MMAIAARIPGQRGDDSQGPVPWNGTDGLGHANTPYQKWCPRATPAAWLRGRPCAPSTEPRSDDLRGHDHDEIGDRDGREEPERRTPGAPSSDRPGPGRLRDDEVRHDRADGEDERDVDRDRREAEVTSWQGDP